MCGARLDAATPHHLAGGRSSIRMSRGRRSSNAYDVDRILRGCSLSIFLVYKSNSSRISIWVTKSTF